MADEAYRAVFLRVHPTGKMVLSLTTESDGKEAQYAQIVADELGIPPLDVKVVAADTDRFGVGHGYNTELLARRGAGDRRRHGQDSRQGPAAGGYGAGSLPGEPQLVQRRMDAWRRGPGGCREPSRTSRCTPTAPAPCPRVSRVGSTPRPSTATDGGSDPRQHTLWARQRGPSRVKTGRNGAAAKAGHDLLIEVAAWQATLEVGEDPAQTSLRFTPTPASLRVREGTGGMQSLGEDEQGQHPPDDRRRGSQGRGHRVPLNRGAERRRRWLDQGPGRAELCR